MTFDEQLRHAFETLTDRIRDEVTAAVGGLADELTAAAQSDRQRVAAEAGRDARAAAEQDAAARLAEAVSAAETTARAAAERNAADAADARVRQAVEAALASAACERPSPGAAVTRLADAIRALDRSRSLGEVLDTLAGCAAREASRAAVLLVRHDRLLGWRLVGFDAIAGEGRDLDVALEAEGMIAEAARRSLRQDEGAPPSFAAGAERHPRIAVPIALGAEVVAVLYADGESPDVRPGEGGLWGAAIEIMTRHAARVLESATAFAAARSLVGTAGAPAGDRQPAAAADEESARRFARLIVSEIKLYHEADVVAGRQQRDLATRLGGEIARARAMYQERVPDSLRAGTDYFQQELVRTLADGDASLFGAAAGTVER